MPDLYIDHRFRLNGRRLHHFLPLGMAFHRDILGAWVHRSVPVFVIDEISDITAEQIARAVNTLGPGLHAHGAVYSTDRQGAAPVVVHSAQPMPPGWNAMMDEVRANMAEAGLIS